MFNLMDAIRQKQKTQTLPPADSAETAETAQPRALALAENLRKPADFSAGTEFSATIRKDPQTPKTAKPAPTEGYRDLSANPQNPQPPTEKKTQNPYALLIDLAQPLQADVHRLRALLSDDDMRDIAEGQISRSHLLAYFRLMRADGHPLQADAPKPGKTTMKSSLSHADHMKSWKPVHDVMLNHLMFCKHCYAPRNMYCTEGQQLREGYLAAYEHSQKLPGSPEPCLTQPTDVKQS